MPERFGSAMDPMIRGEPMCSSSAPAAGRAGRGIGGYAIRHSLSRREILGDAGPSTVAIFRIGLSFNSDGPF